MYDYKNGIVTGAGSGIGKALAYQLASRGSNLALTDIDLPGVSAVAKDIERRYGVLAKPYQVNHGSRAQTARFMEEYHAEFQQLDLLCVNAGIYAKYRIEDTQLETWEKVMQVNFWGAVYLLDEALPRLIAERRGGILMTASLAGLIGISGSAAYSASKFAVVGLAESIRTELKDYDIKVCALCPGSIKTNLTRNAITREEERPAEIRFQDRFGASAEQAAKAGLEGLAKDRGLVIYPKLHALPWALKRLSPRLNEMLAMGVWSMMKRRAS